MSRKLFIYKITVIFISWMVLCAFSFGRGQEQPIKRSAGYRRMAAKTLRKIPLPEHYHEGLTYSGSDIWISNGERGNTWVIDLASGKILYDIKPVAGFTEAITKMPDGTYALTDWYEKKVFRVNIAASEMTVVSEISVAPEFPAGAVWNGNRLFVITWRRGVLGTRFYLLEMDENFKLCRRRQIKNINEPSQMAWDGENIWITSWYNNRAYRIDVDNGKITGSFRAPLSKATGIAWDGKYFWVTGTYADLYQVEVVNK